MSADHEDVAGQKNKGGRPRKKLDPNDPAFKAAVSQAVDAAKDEIRKDLVAEVTGSISRMRGTPAEHLATGDQSLVQQMVAALLDVVHAGKAVKPLSPEEVQKRQSARSRLIDLILEVQTTDFDLEGAPEAPHYRVLNKTYLTDFVIEPFILDPASKAMVPNAIHWTGIPNAALAPINDWAQRIYDAYIESVGGKVKPVDGADSRPRAVGAGGIVVTSMNISAFRQEGQAHPKSPQAVASLRAGSTTDVMGIRNQNDPRAPTVNVLGTIAPAAVAQQTPKFMGQVR
jgi:hypothetical protein